MALTRVARQCLEGSSFFMFDILDPMEEEEEQDELNNCDESGDLYTKCRKSPEEFYECTGLTMQTFDYILENIEPNLRPKLQYRFNLVSSPVKLFLTLRYLTHGIPFRTLAQTFGLGSTTVSSIIYQTLTALWEALSESHMPQPTQKDFKKISEDFFSVWRFPNCIGSLDERHFQLLKCPHSGVQRCSLKKCFSLVLQAVSDADYKFIYIEVCDKEKKSGDKGTFHLSRLNRLLSEDGFNVPPPKALPGSYNVLPHVLVAGRAYPLKTYLMRPYSSRTLQMAQIIFNKSLSNAQVTIECAFGILTKKWRVLLKPFDTNSEHAEMIIKVCCLLHNIVRSLDGDDDKDFREFMNQLHTMVDKKKPKRSKCNNHSSKRASDTRDLFKKYFEICNNTVPATVT